jgi:hypothetical protein
MIMADSPSSSGNPDQIKGAEETRNDQSTVLGKGSTGPRTEFGKRRSSRNSRRHGIFSRELQLSPEELQEYEALRRGFEADLKPRSALERYLFEDVVTNAWRIKIATRCEQDEIRKLLREKEAQPSESTPEHHFPYDLTPFEIRRRICLLDEVHGCIECSLPLHLREPITKAFGAEFCQTLLEWTSADATLMIMNETLISKSETFGLERPGDSPTAEDGGVEHLGMTLPRSVSSVALERG